MAIWVIKGPPIANQRESEFLSYSIRNGISRFGWSSTDKADLRKLRMKPFSEMDEQEKQCWAKANFLLRISEGDWIVHVNLPHWGGCVAGQVNGQYEYEQEDNEVSDFRHQVKLDKLTILEFNRNDETVVPMISSRLKLQGRYWRIYHEQEFLQTIENVKAGKSNLGKRTDESIGVFHLKKELSTLLSSITEKIYAAHPASHLESFIANVFRKIPGIIEVDENGKTKGWGTDNGADLIVYYTSGLSIANLSKQEILVVQIKSYTGQHKDIKAVAQIETAIEAYKANAGLIITTGEATDELEKAAEDLSAKLNKPIGLIAGDDVAKFVLQYSADFIF